MSHRISASPDQLLLIKMTTGAAGEARALARERGAIHTLAARSDAAGARRSSVLVIGDARAPDTIAIGRRSFDLSHATDRAAFAAALGLRGDAAARVDAALRRAGPDARDELGQLARTLAWAERGAITLRRVVLSGHCAYGALVRGDQPNLPHEGRPYNGTLDASALRLLLSAFPHAAAQVEHLMLAVCFGAYPGLAGFTKLDALRCYRDFFPRLRSVTSYEGKAPRAGSGAEADLRRWARATAGDAAPAREKVFGRCGARTAGERRRAGGVVVTTEGEQRCDPALLRGLTRAARGGQRPITR
jgi:hypothetical protein